MFNFGQKVEERGDLIPKDTLLWCRITVRELKQSRNTNGQMVDLELVVAENQPYAGRKMWDLIMDPFDQRHSQEARDMGMGKVRRILEGVFGARPDAPESYNLPNWEALGGNHVVPVMVTIQKGKDGHEDKNAPDYLSPHSSLKKVVEAYNMLRAGQNLYVKPGSAPKPAAQGAQPSFGMTPQSGPAPAGFAAATPAAAPANAPGWLASPQTAAPPAQPPAAVPAPVHQAPAPIPQNAPQGFAAPVQGNVQQGFQPPANPTAMGAAGAQTAPGFATPAPANNTPGFQAPPQPQSATAAGGFTAPAPQTQGAANSAASPSDQPWNNGAANPAQLPGQ